ncbi:hypothetical protein BH10ACT7_BH10ACT7_29340 [soil metagenome]
MPRTRRRRWPWIAGAALIAVLVPVAIIAVPILTHQNQGSSNQEEPVENWPLEASATGDDGRTREIMILPVEPGGVVDTAALEVGQRIVVSGTGYDGSRGIYVAICVIPDSPADKPGPCVGGVPDQEQSQVAEGTVQFAPSNWINDDWAWKLFGARSYDDNASGTFTAYIEVGEPVGEGFDCRVERCGIYTRNDHTALADRVQDLYVPVAFAP